MKHFGMTDSAPTVSHRDWLRVGSTIGSQINAWAGRNDLVAIVNPEAGIEGVTPAFFNPDSAVIEVNSTKAFGVSDPDTIGNFCERSTHYEFPMATGAIFHEALHARYSLWSMVEAHKVLSEAEFEAIRLLEEGRIEALGVRYFPAQRGFLQASAVGLAVSDMEGTAETLATVSHASTLAGLLLSRVSAGVLTSADVAPLEAPITAILGEDVLAKLRSIWERAQAHEEHSNAEPLYELAREWVRVISARQEEVGEPTPEQMKAMAQALAEALAEVGDSISISSADSLGDQQTAEEWRDQAEAREAQGKESDSHKAVARKIFKRETTHGEVGETNKSRSQLIEKRAPTGQERQSAVKIATMLERAKYRERSQVRITSHVPQGKLRTKAILQNKALASQGSLERAEAWRRTAR